ncbi:glycosyltransferase family 2 protein [Methanothrix soehngenii]|mgnify:FL=1|uniref:glycosyltransferase family 2 protein n=1 Tax=Methanothrix soehngenii TaxID=2223 RepID=UPI002FE1DF53
MPRISLIIPTRNESQTIRQCIQRALEAFEKAGLEGEIIVVDSSTDQTADIAASCGAKVVFPQRLGYGNAYLLGFQEAGGDYIFLMDGDLTYDPETILDMLPCLESGEYDLVMGSRLKGRIIPGAMPALHRYVGNPILTWILNRLFSAGISDAHCGLRGITRDALYKLNLRSGGMEFASEMVIEAASRGLRIAEVPITYYPRRGDSKLNSFTDGWRHMRFMMLYRPGPFLLVPGLVALLLGLILAVVVYIEGGSRMHSLILGGLLLIIGYQMLLAGMHFRAFGAAWGLSKSSGMKKLISYHSLEKELLIGLALLAAGIVIGLMVLMRWRGAGFGALDAAQNAMVAMILTILGIQTIFSGMFISLLLLYNGHQDGE